MTSQFPLQESQMPPGKPKQCLPKIEIAMRAFYCWVVKGGRDVHSQLVGPCHLDIFGVIMWSQFPLQDSKMSRCLPKIEITTRALPVMLCGRGRAGCTFPILATTFTRHNFKKPTQNSKFQRGPHLLLLVGRGQAGCTFHSNTGYNIHGWLQA